MCPSPVSAAISPKGPPPPSHRCLVRLVRLLLTELVCCDMAEGSPDEKISPSRMKIPQLRLPHNRCQPSTLQLTTNNQQPFSNAFGLFFGQGRAIVFRFSTQNSCI